MVTRNHHGIDEISAAYSGQPIEESVLLASCRGKLPSYMVPARFIRLGTIPTNANGKADRRAAAAQIAQERWEGHG
jgi:D-alanine--poly(phosphoribitol) ligase subunit 1